MNTIAESERFWNKVNKSASGGCWLWTGKLNQSGYGVIYVSVPDTKKRRVMRVHRVAYEAAKGLIPAGLEIDHLCRVRHCLNPDHLEAVTHRENMRRSMSLSAVTARTGICQRGHAMTEDNTYRRPDGTRRICRECARLRSAARKERLRAARPHGKDAA